MDLTGKKKRQITWAQHTEVTWYPEGYLKAQAKRKAAKQTARNEKRGKGSKVTIKTVVKQKIRADASQSHH